ncbi:MAG TPA: acyl carrier protein [Xanthomonadaceae bacterium]|jgi:acyl carrier protein|nr:acyl carrier protein [Xanthomonadaceae bacterium]
MTPNEQRIIDALQGAGIDFDLENFAPSRSFRDNGIDSLDVMGLFLAIEEKHGVKFSEQEADAIKTPGELGLALDRKLG